MRNLFVRKVKNNIAMKNIFIVSCMWAWTHNARSLENSIYKTLHSVPNNCNIFIGNLPLSLSSPWWWIFMLEGDGKVNNKRKIDFHLNETATMLQTLWRHHAITLFFFMLFSHKDHFALLLLDCVQIFMHNINIQRKRRNLMRTTINNWVLWHKC